METADYVAPRFDLYLDSVRAVTESFAMQERLNGVPFPKAVCGPLDLKWDVTEPVLYASTKEEPIRRAQPLYGLRVQAHRAGGRGGRVPGDHAFGGRTARRR